MLEKIQRRRDNVTTIRSFLKCLKSRKVGDGLLPLELENGAKCMLDCILQRRKGVVLEGLMRMVMGNEVGWSRKYRNNKRNMKEQREGSVEF